MRIHSQIQDITHFETKRKIQKLILCIKHSNQSSRRDSNSGSDDARQRAAVKSVWVARRLLVMSSIEKDEGGVSLDGTSLMERSVWEVGGIVVVVVVVVERRG